MNIVFMGTPDFAVASLQALMDAGHRIVGVVTVPDRPTGRGLKLTPSPVKRFAQDCQLPLLQPERLRDAEFQDSLRAWGADLFVVVAFRMLPQSVWDMPRLGTINLHASLLPRYRGAAPINWAIINGETETGVTTFLLNGQIDRGAILMQERVPILPDDNAGILHDRLASVGSGLLVRTVEGLADNTLTPTVQPEGDDMPPAPKLFKADCAIRWQQQGKQVVDFVRGLSPYPAATMQLADPSGALHQFKVFQVEFHPESDSTAGAVQTDGKTCLKIGVEDGNIHILSLQASGKQRVTIAEYLRGHSVTNWKVV